MNTFLRGLLSGTIATVPMTVVMFKGHSALPKEQQYPLPPREIVENIATKISVDEYVSETGFQAATWISHFSYGALMGALYSLASDRLPGRPVTKGVTFGLAVWVGSYTGWLPAMKILKPAREHPPRRSALMIASHVVLGATLGMTEHLLRSNTPISRRNGNTTDAVRGTTAAARESITN